jgi:hypothetical protein
MADKKISALPAATTPLAGTEVLPVVQGGTTDQVSVANLTAGRDVATKNVTTTSGRVQVNFDGSAGAPMLDLRNSSGTQWELYTPTSDNSLKLDVWVPGQRDSVFSIQNAAGSHNITVSTGNVVIGTAGKGITTGSAIPLGFGVNNTVTAMTIDTSGNLLVGAATTAGAATNVKFVTGGIFSTANGSAASTSAVAATLFAANGTDNEVYIVSAAVPGGAPALYVAVYLVTCGGGTLSATALQTATNISISVSGLNVQSTQISGAPQNIAWKALRVA